jgi:hypothetical protein
MLLKPLKVHRLRYQHIAVEVHPWRPGTNYRATWCWSLPISILGSHIMIPWFINRHHHMRNAKIAKRPSGWLDTSHHHNLLFSSHLYQTPIWHSISLLTTQSVAFPRPTQHGVHKHSISSFGIAYGAYQSYIYPPQHWYSALALVHRKDSAVWCRRYHFL